MIAPVPTVERLGAPLSDPGLAGDIKIIGLGLGHSDIAPTKNRPPVEARV